ncbi:MAG: polyamine ABC transporter substrate-binding protein [Gemmatimonadales bacterium]
MTSSDRSKRDPSRRTFLQSATVAAVGSSTAAAFLAACGKTPPRDLSGDLGPIEPQLNLYLWSDYLAPDTVSRFESEHGVRVTLDTYESNEEMAAKLLAGATGYDLVLPSSYLFPLLRGRDLIAPLNRRYLSNIGNLAPAFADPVWDPGSVHSIPWGWGTTGIAYRKDRLPSAPDSWGVFHDATYRGKMTMLDDARDVIGSFLRYRGRSINSVDPGELALAKQDALQAKPNLRAYASAPVKSQLIAGDVWLSQMWSGDAAQAMAEQPEIAFVVPKEGSMIFADALVMLRSAPHPRAAHAFLDYVLRPDVAAAIADATGYGTPNQAAQALTRLAPAYPSATELERLEYQRDLGPGVELWDRIWTEIKAA